MVIKGIIDEDFVNYKKPSMTIEFPYCSFKCDKECGQQVCQNSALVNGYTEEELKDELPILKQFGNIIIKFGRFIPNSLHKFDNILGVELASHNQYAKFI